MTQDRKPLSAYKAPRYWPVWFGMGLLWLICKLPHRAALAVGRWIGRLAQKIAGSRRKVVSRNLELCFPDLSEEARDDLNRRHFEALGMSLIEMGIGRWASDDKLRSLMTLEGVEHLEAAVAEKRGIILLSAHFTTLESSGRVLGMHSPPFDAVYRRNRSEFITELLRHGREISAAGTIEKRDIRQMVRSLKNARPVWYAPDQSYDRKGAEVIEFFGVPCMHTTATSTLARLGNAIVLPYFPRRDDDGTYTLRILPPLSDIPSGDPVADTNQYVSVLEDHIRTCPEQYFWIHKKFKNLPEGYPNYYAADFDASK